MRLNESVEKFEKVRESVERIKTDLERINKEVQKLEETLKEKVSNLIDEKFDKEI
ncbi:hypothetical protein GF327_06440 [Candidatus Woesearchaeota archaeon]|nr:hypothetical protein [Candidatus Woesearchaeota archaeon]